MHLTGRKLSSRTLIFLVLLAVGVVRTCVAEDAGGVSSPQEVRSGLGALNEMQESPNAQSRAGIVEVAGAVNPTANPMVNPTANPAANPGDAASPSADPSDQTGAAPAASGVPATNAVAPAAQRGFWSRLGKAYYDDWFPVKGGVQDSPHRGYAPVVTAPPWPFTVWPMGGTVWIGYNNATSYPLTTALQTGPHGDWWKKANIQIYGWANVGMNFSTSSEQVGGRLANAPAAYNQLPNSIQLDQLVTYIERTPDTIQTDHFDWGFRFTSLYGLDYRFTTSEGIFSHQLLQAKPDGTIGNTYGWDPVMAYIDLYFPHVADGMILRVGRYVSLPDIEAQLAPNNYTYMHSLTYVYDCYTQQGINATIKLGDHWTWQGGFSAGCDSSIWTKDAKPTGNVCLQYMWREGNDNIYACANSINDSKYAYNNLAAYYLTWYHKFNSKWHADFESWYQFMKDTPNIFNTQGQKLIETNSNGAWCKQVSEVTCYAPEWALLNYVNRQLGNRDTLTLRDEFFDDLRGQRTGVKGRYVEAGLSWNHWIGSTIVFRPELRWEHNFDNPAYDGGNRHSQFMFAADMIWFY